MTSLLFFYSHLHVVQILKRCSWLIEITAQVKIRLGLFFSLVNVLIVKSRSVTSNRRILNLFQFRWLMSRRFLFLLSEIRLRNGKCRKWFSMDDDDVVCDRFWKQSYLIWLHRKKNFIRETNWIDIEAIEKCNLEEQNFCLIRQKKKKEDSKN